LRCKGETVKVDKKIKNYLIFHLIYEWCFISGKGLLRFWYHRKKRNNAIWVVVDRLTKLAFFLPLTMTNPIDKVVKLYVKDVVRLHGVLISVMFDHHPRSSYGLWARIQNAMGMELKLSIAFHLQTNKQTERTIQNLEDFLTTCIQTSGGLIST